MKKFLLSFGLMASVLLMSACDHLPQLTGPSSVNSSNNSSNGSGNSTNLSSWSPYVVVHTPGNALEAYRQTMPALIANGNLRGVRIGIYKGEGNNFVNQGLLDMGLEGLGIIDNYYLFDPNIEQVMDDAIRWYPRIKVFQIGNELTTILPKSGPQISVEQYMAVFDRIYRHVERNYPDIKLVTQSTFGSGSYGSIELERMDQLGLHNYSPSRVFIGLNCYSVSSAVNYASVLDSHSFRGYQVWVTETGISDPEQQVEFVQRVYPVLVDYLRPARDRFGNPRIYWYTYYGGDSLPDGGYGLIKNLSNPEKSPLYRVLAGEGK